MFLMSAFIASPMFMFSLAETANLKKILKKDKKKNFFFFRQHVPCDETQILALGGNLVI